MDIYMINFFHTMKIIQSKYICYSLKTLKKKKKKEPVFSDKVLKHYKPKHIIF